MAEKQDKIQKYEKASPLFRDEDGNIIIEQDKPIVMQQMEEGFETQIAKLVTKSGKLKLTPQQKNILYDRIREDSIEIRPDGLVYIPWMEYVTRLRESFGMEWSIIPKGMPKVSPGGDTIMWGFYLIIQGNLCGFAIGEQIYHRNNPEMTWGDACEGAKSNALMRLCKQIGINLEMWKPSYVAKWKRKYAEKYTGLVRGVEKTLWRKKAEEEEKPKQKAEPKKERKKEEKKKDAEKKAAKEKPEAKSVAAKTEDKGAEPEEDKEELIEKINKKIEDATFDKKDFRLFLAGLQETKNMKGRVFVVADDKGKPSFYAAKTEDLKTLLTHFDWAKGEYIKFKKREG
jgi:hypothetical protein